MNPLRRLDGLPPQWKIKKLKKADIVPQYLIDTRNPSLYNHDTSIFINTALFLNNFIP